MTNFQIYLDHHLTHMKSVVAKMQAEIDAAEVKGIVDNNSRTVVHDEDTIYVFLKKSGIVEEFDYSPDLYFFLVNNHLCSFICKEKQNFRTQIELLPFKRAGGSRCCPPTAMFAHCYYHSGLPAERFMLTMPVRMVELRTAGLEIEHATDDLHNHCSWNLSAVPPTANKHKGILVSRIKPPYYCFPVTTSSGGYRIECGWVNPHASNGLPLLSGQRFFVYCEGIASLISFLKSFVCSCESNTVSEDLRVKSRDYFAGNFDSEKRAAKRLLSMSDEEFYTWQPSSEWTHICSAFPTTTVSIETQAD